MNQNSICLESYRVSYVSAAFSYISQNPFFVWIPFHLAITPSRFIHYVMWICEYANTHVCRAYSIIVWTHPNEHKTIYPLFRCATHALILIIIAVQTNFLLSYILHALFGTAGCCFSNFLLALTHQISNEIQKRMETNKQMEKSNRPPNLTIRCFLI